MQAIAALWKTAWRFLKKLKIELPYDPAITRPGIYPKDTDIVQRRAICTPVFIAAVATIAEPWKEPRCPSTDEWIQKMWSVCTMEYHSAICIQMEGLEGILLSEINQLEQPFYTVGGNSSWCSHS